MSATHKPKRKNSESGNPQPAPRHWITLTACGIAVAAVSIALLIAYLRLARPADPNVLILVLDTVRADAIGVSGPNGPITPNINHLANEGNVFTRTFSEAPWTIPSHASLFTSLYPHQHKAIHERFKLDDSLTTMAEILKARGYQTAGFTCNPWLNKLGGMGQGFETYLEIYKLDNPNNDKGAVNTTVAIREWISQHDRRKPFFVFANYLEAHLPYKPPKSALERLGLTAPYPFNGDFTIQRAEQHITGQKPLSDTDVKNATALYRAEIAYLDEQVGLVVDTLRQQHLLDNTIVIITSDHGEHIGSHGLTGHEFSIYEELLHVPLIVRLPVYLPNGKRITAPVGLIDVLPTVLDIIGGKSVAGLIGTSLLPALNGADPNDQRVMLAEYSRPFTLINNYWKSKYPNIDMSRYDTILNAVRKGDLKYIISSTGQQLLFDLSTDPNEENNLAKSAPEKLIRMSNELKKITR